MGRASWVKGRPCALGNTGNELGSHFSLVRSVVQNSDCVLRRGGVDIDPGETAKEEKKEAILVVALTLTSTDQQHH